MSFVALAAHHIACTLDLIEGSMSVRTTRKVSTPNLMEEITFIKASPDLRPGFNPQRSRSYKTSLPQRPCKVTINSRCHYMLTPKFHIQAPQAIKVLEDGVAADIIKIRNQVANKEVWNFVQSQVSLGMLTSNSHSASSSDGSAYWGRRALP